MSEQEEESAGVFLSSDWLKSLIQRVRSNPEKYKADEPLPSHPRTARDYLEHEELTPVFSEKSPNGRFEVAIREGEGQGTVALAENDNVLWEKAVELPKNPSVTDDGWVLVESWQKLGGREGTVLVFGKTGKVLFEKFYDQTLRSTGISSRDSIAWVTVDGSEDEEARHLLVYDVLDSELLLKVVPPLYSVEGVNKRDSGLSVNLGGFECQYVDGEIANPKKVKWGKEEHRLDATESPYVAARIAKKRLIRIKEFSESQVRSTIDRLSKCTKSGSTASSRARAYRRRGELYHYLEEKEKALEDFEKALSLDEGVGVKRKTRKLRKEIESEEE